MPRRRRNYGKLEQKDRIEKSNREKHKQNLYKRRKKRALEKDKA